MDENDYSQIKTSSESALKDQLCGRIRKKEPAIIKKKLKKDLFHQTPDHLSAVAAKLLPIPLQHVITTLSRDGFFKLSPLPSIEKLLS
jgi:hypothetical protein